MVTYRNNLSITPGGAPLRIYLNQNDANFSLVFDLYTVTGEFTMQSGSTVKMTGRHWGGTEFTKTGTYSGKTVTIAGDKTLTAVAGESLAEITITNSGKQLSTANFILVIEPKA